MENLPDVCLLIDFSLLKEFNNLIPAIRSLLVSKSKQDAVIQEQEKLDEQKRAAIKFLVYVSTNDNISNRFSLCVFSLP